MGRTVPVLLAGTLTIAASAALAFAQEPRGYIGASVSAFRVHADEVDGVRPAPGVGGGFALSPFVDLEMEAAWPSGEFTRSYSGVSVSFAPPGSSFDEIQRQGVVTRYDKRREVSVHVSAVAVIHPAGPRRFRPGLIAGVASQRVRDETVYTTLSLPDGVDPQHPAIPRGVEQSARNIGGPTIGGQLAITVSRRVRVVPDVRFDYGSIGDEINNTWRSSLRIYWVF
jgi:hypothetical protein